MRQVASPRKIELLTEPMVEELLLEHLRRRQLPDALLYADPAGARAWLELEGSESFPIATDLTVLLRRHLEAIVAEFAEPVSVVSIGAGGGVKERLLLEALGPQRAAAYCPVDVSSMLVDRAMTAAGDLEVATTGIVALLEQVGQCSRYWRPPALVCLLGNTFCNFEPRMLLSDLLVGMDPSDTLLIDCHAAPPQATPAWREQVLQAYRSQVNEQFNLGPLLRRGVRAEQCRFELELAMAVTPWGPALRTSKRIRMMGAATATVAGQEVPLAAGDVIRMGFTYKYTPLQMLENLLAGGFRIERCFWDAGDENLLILARPDGGPR